MTGKRLRNIEEVVCNSAYNLARNILNEYNERGFDYNNDSDIKQIRTINAISALLEELGDLRYFELKIYAADSIKFPPSLEIIK